MPGRSPEKHLLPALLAALTLNLSCAVPMNYTHPGGPAWTGSYLPLHPPADELRLGSSGGAAARDELRVVTFNIKFSREVGRAISVLRRDPALRDADIVLLQEMEEKGVRRIASALSMSYVYYPATLHPRTGRRFGNAILARWPLRDDRKVLLPHLARLGRTQRIAVGATVTVRGVPLRVYSIHVATGIEVSPSGRRDQVRALLDDAGPEYPLVIAGGDLNAKGLGRLFADRGYEWPTRDLGRTCLLASADHIFLRGLRPRRGASAGKVGDNLGASDHKPVWVALEMPPPEMALRR